MNVTQHGSLAKEWLISFVLLIGLPGRKLVQSSRYFAKLCCQVERIE